MELAFEKFLTCFMRKEFFLIEFASHTYCHFFVYTHFLKSLRCISNLLRVVLRFSGIYKAMAWKVVAEVQPGRVAQEMHAARSSLRYSAEDRQCLSFRYSSVRHGRQEGPLSSSCTDFACAP